MTIEDLYNTCCPKHATEPTRVTPDIKQPEQIKPEQTAETAGEEAEKVIEKMPEQNTETVTEETVSEEKGEAKNEESAE